MNGFEAFLHNLVDPLVVNIKIRFCLRRIMRLTRQCWYTSPSSEVANGIFPVLMELLRPVDRPLSFDRTEGLLLVHLERVLAHVNELLMPSQVRGIVSFKVA